MLYVFLLLQSLDCLTTLVALRLDLAEGNPILASLLAHHG